MKGTIVSIYPSGAKLTSPFDKPATLEDLKKGVGGGYIEHVPMFSTYVDKDGTVQRCEVFCDEEGKLKRFEINRDATILWYNALIRGGFTEAANALRRGDDVLVGTIAIVYGDEEFMHGTMHGDDDE